MAKPLTPSAMKKRLRSIIGHRRKGVVKVRMHHIPTRQHPKGYEFTGTFDLSDAMCECRINTYCSAEWFGNQITQIEEVTDAALRGHVESTG